MSKYNFTIDDTIINAIANLKTKPKGDALATISTREIRKINTNTDTAMNIMGPLTFKQPSKCKYLTVSDISYINVYYACPSYDLHNAKMKRFGTYLERRKEIVENYNMIDDICRTYKSVPLDPKYDELLKLTSEQYNNEIMKLGVGINATCVEPGFSGANKTANLSNFLSICTKGSILLDSWHYLLVNKKDTSNPTDILEALNNARAFIVQYKIPFLRDITMHTIGKFVVENTNVLRYLRRESEMYHIFYYDDIFNILHKCYVHLIYVGNTQYQWNDNEIRYLDANVKPTLASPIAKFKQFARPIGHTGGYSNNVTYKINKYIEKSKRLELLLKK